MIPEWTAMPEPGVRALVDLGLLSPTGLVTLALASAL